MGRRHQLITLSQEDESLLQLQRLRQFRKKLNFPFAGSSRPLGGSFLLTGRYTRGFSLWPIRLLPVSPTL